MSNKTGRGEIISYRLCPRCGKNSYESKKQAEEVGREQKAKIGVILKAYQCPTGNGYHLTKIQKSKTEPNSLWEADLLNQNTGAVSIGDFIRQKQKTKNNGSNLKYQPLTEDLKS